MAKSADAFRTISEVADWLGVQAHVLRFWESKFTQVKPVKRAGGRRYYRPQDMRLLGGIRKLLHDDGMTIKGVQKTLRDQGMAYVASLSDPLEADLAEAEAPVMATPSLAEPPKAAVLTFQPAPASTAEDDDALQPFLPLDVPETPSVTATAPEPAPEEVAEVPLPEAPTEEIAREEPTLAEALPAGDEAPAPVAAAPTPRIVDAPDPPEEAEITASLGPLSRLAQAQISRAASPDALRPLLAQLAALTDQMDAPTRAHKD